MKNLITIISLFTTLVVNASSSQIENFNQVRTSEKLSLALQSSSMAFVHPLKTQALQKSALNTRPKLTAVYLASGFDLGKHNFLPGFGVSANFLMSNNWGGSISIKNKSFVANNLPNDYEQPAFYLFGNGIPHDQMEMVSATVTRRLPVNSKMVRFGVELGPTWVRYSQVEFTKSDRTTVTMWGAGSNYNTSFKEIETIGLLSRVKIELPLTRFIGCEFAAYSNINKYRSFIGIEAYLTFGSLRSKLSH